MPRFPSARLVPIMLVTVLASQACREPEPTASDSYPDIATAAAALAFRQVSVGPRQTCGVTTGDLAYCWGSGPPGSGSKPAPDDCGDEGPCSTRPVRVVGGLRFREVSAEGLFHVCGVTTANVAYCWGANDSGQLGDGSETDSPRPVRVSGGLAFRQVSAGTLHTCGVTTGDVAYCWGHNQAGEIGDGSTDARPEPVKVASGLAFRQVSAGEQFTCGLTTNDVAYCWGMNTVGQLGAGTDAGPETCFTGDGHDACSTRPVRVLRHLAFSHVSAGYSHVCAIAVDDGAWCWGSNHQGQLGQRTTSGPETCSSSIPCSTKPVRVRGQLAFSGLDGGAFHTCGVTTHAVGYCWGSNATGALGIGSKSGPETCLEPIFGNACSTRPLEVLGGLGFRTVEVGLASSCGVTTGDVAYCWGLNLSGQVGDGTTQSRPRPRRVIGPI